jgi:hypothetical protein
MTMPQRLARRQRQLFEEPAAAPAVQERLRQTLVQWMQALAKTIRKEEAGDEQDHR